VAAPIVSATTEEQLNALFAATELTLDAEDLESLAKAGGV
jgi:aryl-alcohol dehydrogenase-like predicted oxidoreductase